MSDSPRVMRITSLNNPRVKAAARLHEQGGAGGRRETGLFLAEGLRQVTRAAAAGLRIVELFVCSQLLGDDIRALLKKDASGPSLADSLRSGLTDCFDVPPTVLKKMTYRRDPEGVLAVVEQPRWTLEQLNHLCLADDAPLLLVAVGTAKPGNLGAMVRTADAAGCAAVLAAGTPVDAFNPNAIRASTGAVFTMPVICTSEEEAIAWLAGSGMTVVAASLQATRSHIETDMTGPLAIVIGPEDTGLSDAWVGEASPIDGRDARPTISPVMIPMHGRTADSLNASNAAAVLLFEALRQREQI